MNNEPHNIEPTPTPLPDSRREICLDIVRRMPEIALGEMTWKLLKIEEYWSDRRRVQGDSLGAIT